MLKALDSGVPSAWTAPADDLAERIAELAQRAAAAASKAERLGYLRQARELMRQAALARESRPPGELTPPDAPASPQPRAPED